MTANQIAFAQLKEGIRHNMATEDESVRHNQETERHNWYTADSLVQLQKAQTAKTASEVGLSQRQHEETMRHNQATERAEVNRNTEVIRSNKANEDLRNRELRIKQYDAVTGRFNSAWNGVRAVGSVLDNIVVIPSSAVKSLVPSK